MAAIRICSWCHKHLDEKDKDIDIQSWTGDVTHGICLECSDFLLSDDSGELDKFLDRLKIPVLVVRNDGTVETASQSALQMLGKNISQIKDFRGGEVMECTYSRLPGGCGQTEHCVGCTIRNTVMKTHQTGEDQLKVKAYQNIVVEEGIQKTYFLVSTHKFMNFVLLKIEDIQAIGETKPDFLQEKVIIDD